MRKTLTDKGVAAFKPRAERYAFPDPELRGHYVRVQPSGARAFVAVARDPYGKQVWATIGAADVLGIEEARDRARKAIKRIKAGLPPIEPPPIKSDSVKDVAENWLRRYVAAKKLRSEREIRRTLEKYVLPYWADRDFVSIKRSDVAALLDQIEDDHGSRMADIVKAYLSGIANWFAKRNDEYRSPFVRGMNRHGNGTRSRILEDNELRAIWKQAEVNGRFGAVVRLLLLTAQRREKVVNMKWADINNGVWTIATAEREKGNAGSLALPAQALAIIKAQPKIGENPYVFAGRGNSAAHMWQFKTPFDRKLPNMPRWTLHDLRRSSRSLMARAGVRPDIAERVLGHAIKGVEGTYDRHTYGAQKGQALAKLATLIDSIVNPRDNVVPMANTRKRK